MNIISTANDKCKPKLHKMGLCYIIDFSSAGRLALGMTGSRRLNNVRNPFHTSPLVSFTVALFIGLPK